MGVSSVAAPVRIGNIGVIYSVGATGPVRRFTSAKRAGIGAQLQGLAGKVGNAIGLYGAGGVG